MKKLLLMSAAILGISNANAQGQGSVTVTNNTLGCTVCLDIYAACPPDVPGGSPTFFSSGGMTCVGAGQTITLYNPVGTPGSVGTWTSPLSWTPTPPTCENWEWRFASIPSLFIPGSIVAIGNSNSIITVPEGWYQIGDPNGSYWIEDITSGPCKFIEYHWTNIGGNIEIRLGY